MTPADVVIARLEDIEAVTELVATRIYQGKLPQSPTLMAIRVQNIEPIQTLHLRGPDGKVTGRVQIDAYQDEGSGVDALGNVQALAAAIHGDGLGPNATGLQGWIGDIGSPATHVHGMFRADYAETSEMDEKRTWRVRQDYMVHMT